MKNAIVVFLILFSITLKAQVKVGQQAPEISLPDTKGNTTSLSSLKGKVVLVDFWASWCRPCRASIPAVIKLYNQYKTKGFEVFGVSIDEKKKDWLKAITQDNITYMQVNDKAGWYAKVTEAYGVNEIPATFLLDKKGEIVGVNLEGPELEKKISELLQ
jgi:peroxiredoxin